MKNICFALAMTLALAVTGLILTAPPALAENQEMIDGVNDFNSGDFKSAESHFGCARQAEFSNPKFHYYMANTYIHTNKKELAIQEFRIAYALAPDKEVGKLSKQALGYLGVDSEIPAKGGKSDVKAPTTPLTAKDIALESAKNSLKAQIEQAKNGVRSQKERDQLEMARIQSDALAKTQKELEDRIAKGNGSKDSLKQLEQLKKELENQRTSLEKGNSRVQEIQKSADNLQTLLDEKKTIGSPKLSPLGTNLYVRNYFDDGKSSTVKPPAAAPAQSTTGTPGNSGNPGNSAKPAEKNSSGLQKRTL